MTIVRDYIICAWFTLVGLAFWSPYLGWGLPDLTPLYGLFLLVSAAAMALRLLNGQGREPQAVRDAPVTTPAAAAAAAPPRSARRERTGKTGARRGRGTGG